MRVQDRVGECRELVLEMTSGEREEAKQSKKRRSGCLPGSPNGVVDASFSCDSSNDSCAVAASVSSSPEPLSKKSRTRHQFPLNHPNSDFLGIPPFSSPQ